MRCQIAVANKEEWYRGRTSLIWPCLLPKNLKRSTGFSPFQLLYGRSVRGPGTILKELWTEEVNNPEVQTSYEYVTELRERLEDLLKLTREELQKSQNTMIEKPNPDVWK